MNSEAPWVALLKDIHGAVFQACAQQSITKNVEVDNTGRYSYEMQFFMESVEVSSVQPHEEVLERKSMLVREADLAIAGFQTLALQTPSEIAGLFDQERWRDIMCLLLIALANNNLDRWFEGPTGPLVSSALSVGNKETYGKGLLISAMTSSSWSQPHS